MIKYLKRSGSIKKDLSVSYSFEKVQSIVVRKALAVFIETGIWGCLLKSWQTRKQISSLDMHPAYNHKILPLNPTFAVLSTKFHEFSNSNISWGPREPVRYISYINHNRKRDRREKGKKKKGNYNIMLVIAELE